MDIKADWDLFDEILTTPESHESLTSPSEGVSDSGQDETASVSPQLGSWSDGLTPIPLLNITSAGNDGYAVRVSTDFSMVNPPPLSSAVCSAYLISLNDPLLALIIT